MVDWGISSSDTVLRNHSHQGISGSANGAPDNNVSCPTYINGSSTNKKTLAAACSDSTYTDSALCTSNGKRWYGAQTFFINAIELISSDGGDDDGLCESGETCLYTPNFGAYQGHGALGTCTFNNGSSFTGVTMRFYTTNGR
jgi:hypothetical protein